MGKEKTYNKTQYKKGEKGYHIMQIKQIVIRNSPQKLRRQSLQKISPIEYSKLA